MLNSHESHLWGQLQHFLDSLASLKTSWMAPGREGRWIRTGKARARSSQELPFHGAWMTSECHGQQGLNVPSLPTSKRPRWEEAVSKENGWFRFSRYWLDPLMICSLFACLPAVVKWFDLKASDSCFSHCWFYHLSHQNWKRINMSPSDNVYFVFTDFSFLPLRLTAAEITPTALPLVFSDGRLVYLHMFLSPEECQRLGCSSTS